MILEAMKEDPEYRQLAYKHVLRQEAGDIEIFIEEQVAEKRKNVMKAIHSIEQRERRDRGNLGQQLYHTMIKNLLAEIEVAEVHSPPRVIRMVEQMGLRVGWAFDLTIYDEDGRPWVFDQFEMSNRAVHKLFKDEPILFIGSPLCTAFN